MKHIRRQRTLKDARRQMSGVFAGDIVIVHIRRKEIPCVVRLCCYNICMYCILRREPCRFFRGRWDRRDGLNSIKAFIPLEDAVE